MKLLSGILAHGESSKLYNRLIYGKKIAKEATSYVFGMENVSLFVIDSIMINKSKLKKVSAETDLIIEELRNDISESDVDKIKNAIETYNNLKLQTIVSVSERLSHYKTFYNECDLINDEIERYLEISRTDISDAMNKYILNNKRVALNYLPKEKI